MGIARGIEMTQREDGRYEMIVATEIDRTSRLMWWVTNNAGVWEEREEIVLTDQPAARTLSNPTAVRTGGSRFQSRERMSFVMCGWIDLVEVVRGVEYRRTEPKFFRCDREGARWRTQELPNSREAGEEWFGTRTGLYVAANMNPARPYAGVVMPTRKRLPSGRYQAYHAWGEDVHRWIDYGQYLYEDNKPLEAGHVSAVPLPDGRNVVVFGSPVGLARTNVAIQRAFGEPWSMKSVSIGGGDAVACDANDANGISMILRKDSNQLAYAYYDLVTESERYQEIADLGDRVVMGGLLRNKRGNLQCAVQDSNNGEPHHFWRNTSGRWERRWVFEP